MHCGLPSLTTELALVAERVGMTGQFPHMKTVFLASEMVYDYQREIIERVFEAYLCEHYGLRELVALFFICEKGQRHVIPEYSYVEFITEDGRDALATNARIAEVVGTGFYEYAFPLIRYQTNDLVELGENTPCECGRQ